MDGPVGMSRNVTFEKREATPHSNDSRTKWSVNDLSEGDREAFEERAAIFEYEAGMSRFEAAMAAWDWIMARNTLADVTG